MKAMKIYLWFSAALLGAAVGVLTAQDVRQGLVSHWPLDALSVDLFSTPDVVSGNDFETFNFLAVDVVPGQRGQAFNLNSEWQTHLWHLTPAGVRTMWVRRSACPTWPGNGDRGAQRHRGFA